MNQKTNEGIARKKKTQTGSSDTTENDFLDAAERQFAENGYAGAKIRAIAEEAEANLGALHYYWGSKESLFRAACSRRMQPVIAERMRRYDEFAGRAPTVEEILRAYFEPAFLSNREDPPKRAHFCRIYARILTDPSPEVKTIMAEIFSECTARFVTLLRGTCKHLDDNAFYWRLHCVFGVFQHAATYTDNIGILAGGKFDMTDLDAGIDRIIHFVAAGLKAPAI
ncbi:TetR/AcrR family transcriptional regulator [Rhizobium sp. LjRoot254]|uniref:TetR/AcrR family transcriptional regulator n=1 Tax=Rhizobium sp. LjRoot254 TaxID=3342297 RepID=UPI003ED13876